MATQVSRKTIKLKYDTPFNVESTLVQKFGYHVVKRQFQEYIMYSKVCNLDTETRKEIPVPQIELTDAKKNELEIRCDRIAEYFPDPYAAWRSVRIRLHNMMQTLPSAAERQFVLEYMDDNFPVGG